MKVIEGRNINEAYQKGVQIFKDGIGIRRVKGRNDEITDEYVTPVTTVYQRPNERVLFDPVRNANPYFHFFESIWIIAGRRDVGWLSYFLEGIRKYSDDGIVFHGAYGYRLRHGEHDQIAWLASFLDHHSSTRRAVVNLFDHRFDHAESKDIPCNATVAFLLRDGFLDITVFCRSNDMVLGAYGANAVQFSVLQEILAGCLNAKIGTYTQVSNSFHVYLDETWKRIREGKTEVSDPYVKGTIAPYEIMANPTSTASSSALRLRIFDTEVRRFMLATTRMLSAKIKTAWTMDQPCRPFFTDVCAPLFNSYYAYKNGSLSTAIDLAKECKATDWRLACVQWLNRIVEKRNV